MYDIQDAIHKLVRGKAAGYDGLTSEHIIFSHPIVAVYLALLFNKCLIRGCVPDAFGRGILFPLLKTSDLDGTCVESYREITVSCIISKLFEICIYDILKEFLVSSDLQFSFKRGTSCRDAFLLLVLLLRSLRTVG